MLAQAYDYRLSGQLMEGQLLPRFLDAATAFRGAKKDDIIDAVLFNYFNAMDPNNITNVALRFINVGVISI